MLNVCGDSVRVARPLFQVEGGGSIPTSPLQLNIEKIDIKKALQLNRLWHSRLPNLTNWQACEAYSAEYSNRFYAVMIFGPPVARAFNGTPTLELRRMAISSDAPKNTASRMISVTIKILRKSKPWLKKIISYQDTDVHAGTIYKASGWNIGHITKKSEIRWGKLSKKGNGRIRNEIIATGEKIRWEKTL